MYILGCMIVDLWTDIVDFEREIYISKKYVQRVCFCAEFRFYKTLRPY